MRRSEVVTLTYPTLAEFVRDFALAIRLADSRRPRAINVRSKRPFKPGIGPHSEHETLRLIVDELKAAKPETYGERIFSDVPYPGRRRQKCDLCVGRPGEWKWAIEVKMLRILGDNGKPNDSMLMHILSPYPQHRSAVWDCIKLANGFVGVRTAMVIYGHQADRWPLTDAIKAFEVLASLKVDLGRRLEAHSGELIHPVHRSAYVFAWEVRAKARRR